MSNCSPPPGDWPSPPLLPRLPDCHIRHPVEVIIVGREVLHPMAAHQRDDERVIRQQAQLLRQVRRRRNSSNSTIRDR